MEQYYGDWIRLPKMMKRKRTLPLVLLALSLGGCQIFGVAAGIVNTLIPIAASVGGALLVYSLTRRD